MFLQVSNITVGIAALVVLFLFFCGAMVVLVISVGNMVDGYLKGEQHRIRDAFSYFIFSFVVVTLFVYLFFRYVV